MVFDHKTFVNMLEAIKEHLKLDMEIAGDNPGMNFPGTAGKSLEFEWKGTKLGIRVEGDKNYKYVDLKGADGTDPHIDSVTNHWFVGTIDTGVNASGTRGADGTTPNLKIGTITTLPSGSKATATITGTPENPVLNLGLPKGDSGDDATNTDEKLKLTAASTQAKYMSDLIDNSTIVIDPTRNVIKAVTLEGLQATITTLNFVKNLDRDIMTYLSAISNPMGFKGVVADDNALAAVTGAMNGDTYIVKNSVSNNGKTMTFIYNGTDFVPIAETTVTVRDFTTNPINLMTEVTGMLGDANIASTIARAADVLDKITYEGSVPGSVKQADKLTGLTATGSQIDTAIGKAHSHGNKSALDNILETGNGTLVLTDDGTYQKIFHVGNTAPSNVGFFWVDTTTTAKPVLKFYNGTTWVAVSSASGGSGSSVTVDSSMSSSSTNPVQNKVVKKYIDDSIPGISTNTGNAMSADPNGDYYVEDKTDDIKANSDKIAEIKKFQKYLNTDLEYCYLGFDVSSVTSEGIVSVPLNTAVPFNKMYNAGGGAIYNLAQHTISLKAGKTYELHATTKARLAEDTHIIRFYDVTNNKYLNNGVRTATSDEFAVLTEIVKPMTDIEVSVRVAWTSKGNHIVQMRTCAVNNTADGHGISSSQTKMNEVFFIAKEINRIISIDPVNYVNTENGIEDTPVGTVIPLMSKSVPAHYLLCNGSTYNISDYPYLAQHIKDEFGSYNYWGGNGTSTFAVPDLRGEFLRGTGTATRNTGSGSAVGAHQDPTSHVNVMNYMESDVIQVRTITGGAQNAVTTNMDTTVPANTYNNIKYDQRDRDNVNPNTPITYTARPTNTSVLWCIKAEPTFFIKIEGKDCYSKDERVVGYWINNKPLYQKTIIVNDIYAINNQVVKHNIPNVEFMIVHEASVHRTGSGLNNFYSMYYPGAEIGSSGSESTLWVNLTDINIRTADIRSGCTGYITLRYTKKTDLPRV